MCGRYSTDAAPVTGSLVFSAPLDCLDVYCAAEFASCWLFCGTFNLVCWSLTSLCHYFAVRIVSGLLDLFFRRVRVYWIMAEGAALVENRAGITFGVELCVAWDAPEAVVDIHSEGVVILGYIPDVIGLTGRRPDAAESRVLQGRDVRSVRVLVPDSRGLDQNFHDVAIVDMGDVHESSVSLQQLSLLHQQWPPAVLRHMVWLQQDLEVMHAEAKQRFRQTRPSSFYCGTWIKCDMYRHGQSFT